jgi:acetyl-CoA carboxylase biotin carboxyl carrier protein
MVFLRAVRGLAQPAVGGRVSYILSWGGDNAVGPGLWFHIGDKQPESGVKMAEDVRAEIVASVLEVVVHEGDQIGEGDTLVLLESMKMEIPVLAEVGGTVTKVSVSAGDVIQAGDLIAVIS